MNVLVDTCVWSRALRRSKTNPADPWVAELHALIQEGRATIIGPIRQEILSGVRNPNGFAQLLPLHLARPRGELTG